MEACRASAATAASIGTGGGCGQSAPGNAPIAPATRRLLASRPVPEASRDEVEVAGRFRPGRSALLVAVVANVALAVVFLGVPWWRERGRALEARAHFADFAACLYGGQAVAAPGLGLPSGDTAHFAARALSGPPDWPVRCRKDLLDVAPPYARFLLPSAAVAEDEVRRAVDLVRRELDAFAETRGDAARVNTRPLRAVAVLRGKLAAMVVASGFYDGLEDDAVRFVSGGGLREASRLPLNASGDAPLRLEARADGLVAFALDARGLGSVHLAAGRVAARRIARPRGASGAIWGAVLGAAQGAAAAGQVPWVVSTTSERRCDDDPQRCARRTMAVSPIGVAATRAPPPFVVGAHPWGGPEGEAVRVLPADAGGAAPRLVVLARSPDAGPVLRVFRLDAGASAAPTVASSSAPTAAARADDAPAPAPALAPIMERALGLDAPLVRAAKLLPDGRPVVLTAEADGFDARVFALEAGPARALGVVPANGDGLLETCAAEGDAWIAYGGGTRVRLTRAPRGEAPSNPAIVDGPDDDGAIDGERARLACDAEGALLVLPLRVGGARVVSCSSDGPCHALWLPDVPRRARVASARDGGLGVLAWAVAASRVRVVRVERDGSRMSAPSVPAPCWDDDTGLCGAPTLAARSGRFVLVTREGSDLRALESIDAGVSWGPLGGLL